MTKLVPVFTLAFVLFEMAHSASLSNSANNAFASKFFYEIASGHDTENVIISPMSIETCIALAFLGAGGSTAEEIATSMHFGSASKNEVASKYENLLKVSKSSSMLTIANTVFASKDAEIKQEFKDVANKAFNAEPQTLDIKNEQGSIKIVNQWIENKTNNKIKDLLTSISPDTKLILVNAIYFKGAWQYTFDPHSTHKREFWTSADKSVQVDTMMNEDSYKYGEWSELDATAIEMPYKDSEFSMLIVLPNKRDGLKNLETKLRDTNLLELTNNKMEMNDVDVMLPKFNAEFSSKLNDPLKKVGMNTMFSDDADFSGLLKSDTPIKVSEVRHKAFIEVNEAGSEAAAATYIKIIPLSAKYKIKRFRADHPFVYLIKDRNQIYFMGHLARF